MKLSSGSCWKRCFLLREDKTKKGGGKVSLRKQWIHHRRRETVSRTQSQQPNLVGGGSPKRTLERSWTWWNSRCIWNMWWRKHRNFHVLSVNLGSMKLNTCSPYREKYSDTEKLSCVYMKCTFPMKWYLRKCHFVFNVDRLYDTSKATHSNVFSHILNSSQN